MKPIVTALIDTFNQGRYLTQAIESLLAQNIRSQDMEIIIIDDGSTDNTQAVISKYKDRVQYIYKSNKGQADSFNIAANIANGQYISFLDADDYCMPNRIAAVLEEFEKSKEVCIVFNSRIIVNDLGQPIFHESRTSFSNVSLADVNVSKLCEIEYGTSRTSVRRSVFRKILPIPEDLTIEADLFFLTMYAYGNASSLSDCLTAYRVHASNLFHTTELSRFPLKIRCLASVLNHIRQYVEREAGGDCRRLYSQILLPYQIELQELQFTLNAAQRVAKRKDWFDIEKLKFGFYRDKWPLAYKIYKILRLPFMLACPPHILTLGLEKYRNSSLKRMRAKLIPTENGGVALRK